MAEASLEQARKILEKSLEGVQATAGSIEERCANASAEEVIAKALAHAEKNVQVDYTQSLLHAKDLPGGDAAASRFRSVADVFAGGTGKRDSQIVSAAMDAAKPKI